MVLPRAGKQRSDTRFATTKRMLKMKNASLSVSVLLVCLFAVGCAGGPKATVSYDAEQNRTTYETRSYTVATGGSNSYGSSKSIDMQVVARCEGTDCSPDSANLVFSASGSETLSLSGVDGKIEAEDVSVSWTSAEVSRGFSNRVSNNEMIEVVGRFAVVTLSLDQLRQVASASPVKGTIGGMRLRFGSGVKSGMQALLRKIDQQGTGRDTSSPEP